MTQEEMQAMLLQMAKDQVPKKAIITIVLAVVCIVALLAGLAWYKHQQHQEAVVLTQQQAGDLNALQNKLGVSEGAAAELKERIAKAQSGQVAPVVTYHVTAPTVQQAAEVTKKQIDAKEPTLPPAAIAPSDRTAVVANTTQQKVDVYKIDLDRHWEVGPGVIYARGKLSPIGSAQYSNKHVAYQAIAGPDVYGAIVKIRF